MQISNLINSLVKNYKKITHVLCLRKAEKHGYSCYLEEIDLKNNTVNIHHNYLTCSIKFRIEDIIYDHPIIANMHPAQASILGYYYGKNYKNFRRSYKHNKYSYALKTSDKQYTLLSQDRYGKISYLNKKTNAIYTRSLIDILSDVKLIQEFSSIEACYIGIMTGIHTNKNPIFKV